MYAVYNKHYALIYTFNSPIFLLYFLFIKLICTYIKFFVDIKNNKISMYRFIAVNIYSFFSMKIVDNRVIIKQKTER